MADFRGPSNARRAVADYLRGPALQRTLERLRADWQLDEADLPAADVVSQVEPAALDRFPLIAVTSGGQRRLRRVDLLPDADVFSATYPVRVYVWVRESGRERVVDVRDDLATAVMVSLVEDVTLGRSDMRVEDGAMSVEPSDVTPVHGDRFVAGAYVGFDLTVEEQLTRPALGVAAAVDVEVSVYADPQSAR